MLASIGQMLDRRFTLPDADLNPLLEIDLLAVKTREPNATYPFPARDPYDFSNFPRHRTGGYIFGHPAGARIRDTFFGDDPAPFECPHCQYYGLTDVRSSPSKAALVGAAITVVGVWFLLPDNDLWHKRHHCPGCHAMVGEFRKDDLLLATKPQEWKQRSFAICCDPLPLPCLPQDELPVVPKAGSE